MLRTLKKFKFRGKLVLLRADLNVPLDEKGNIEDDSRIVEALPTIEYLRSKKARIILMSHLGEPKGEVIENLRLAPVKKRLEKYLKISITKVSDCIGPEVQTQASKLKESQILLLENLRFHKGEEENDKDFVSQLASLGEIYVNDAFGTCHRSHASIVGLAKILPSCAGLLLEKEVKALSKVIKNPKRPLVSIIGGAKIDTKIEPLKNLLKVSDHLLLGGKIANTILAMQGICRDHSFPDPAIEKEVKEIDLTSIKLHLPVDIIVSPDDSGKKYVKDSATCSVKENEMLLDIGQETIRIFCKIISIAKTIVWSGPLGFFEHPAFENGTKEIGKAIVANKKAFKIIGGGDTLFAASKFKFLNRFDHISTGGGAMLDFLSGEKLPGIAVLEDQK